MSRTFSRVDDFARQPCQTGETGWPADNRSTWRERAGWFTFCALVAALMCLAGTVRADEMDRWCSQVKKASSIVICSDAHLRGQAIARNKLFETARAKLSSEAYKKLADDQSRWIKSYTAACGVSVDDPPPSLPIPQSVIECYRRASDARTASLAAYLSVPDLMASMPPTNSDIAAVPPAAPPTAPPASSAALPDESGPTWHCRDPNTNFVYERSEPCARGDVIISNAGHDEIILVEANGVDTVPVLINGVLPLQFVVDSGAADVSIPQDVFSVLKRTGTITGDDYIGTGTYQLADGSVVQSDRFYIRELKVGPHLLKHVSASIGDKAGPLLLGQSFLKRFDSVQVDNTRHVLLLGSEASASAALSPPPTGFTSDQPPPFDPTKPYTVVPSSPSSGNGTAAAPPAQIDLSKIKLSEITRPYYLIHPETVQFIVSNASDQHISEITIGSEDSPGYCPRGLSDYQGFKKFSVNLVPGDSIEIQGEFSSDAKWFCVISAQ